MTKIQGKLLSFEDTATPSYFSWAIFLQEHADYERKASEYALSILGKYPDKTFAVVSLAQVALGSLTMFYQLCELVTERGLQLIPESPQNLYLKQLNWLNRSGREERFLDRILLGSIAESRCANRFKEVSSLLEELPLAVFYNTCSKIKQAHADAYMEIAYQGTADAIVNSRFEILKAEEEKIMANLGVAVGIF